MLKCDICGKIVPKTNYNGIILKDGTRVGICGKHYAQYRKYGKFLDNSPKALHDYNEFKTEGNITKIYTKHKNGDVSGYFIIDTEDLDKIIVRKWRLWKDRFFTGVQKPITISRFIFEEVLNQQLDENVVIDHINHNPSDNRKSNLRICTQQNNVCNKIVLSTNTSGIGGVWFDINRDKWTVEIKCNYIKCHLGRYDKLEDACYVRYIAEQKLFGEFRNKSNDHILVPLANKCQRKEELLKYVNKRITEKFAEQYKNAD